MTPWSLWLAWEWEHDADFIRILKSICLHRGLDYFEVTPGNVEEITKTLSDNERRYILFDRASDSDERFQTIVDWTRRRSLPSINPQEWTRWTHDKATMHLEFLTAGFDLPYTIILPPFHEQPDIPIADLTPLQGAFAIKPSSGGGSEGVILDANTWEQVLDARRQFPRDKYLLQTNVMPRILDGNPGWFRILFCNGAIFPCWWHPKTHHYHPVTAEERFHHGLFSLHQITRRISQICHLDLFSTEIAVTAEGKFTVVDYINDPLDLRLQSSTPDGVPDPIIERIALHLFILGEKLTKE